MSLKGYEKYGGEIDNGKQILWKVRRGQRGKEDGVRPEEGVEPGREPGVEHMKGENGIWKSARDIILMVCSPTSDVVILLAQPVTPSSTRPLLLSTLPYPVPSQTLDYY